MGSGSMIVHLTQIRSLRFDSVSFSARGKLYQSLGGLSPGISQYRVLAYEGRQRYTKYTKP
jgi:hypothetical protein